MKDFRQLKVWEKAHILTLSVYKESGNFQKKNYTVSLHKFAEPVYQSLQILLKGAVAKPTPILPALFKFQWDQQAKWNINCS